MSQDIILLLLGLTFLLGGGEALVRGSSAIARSTGVPPIIVGLTIVAFGTSAPELAVNVFAAWRGTGGLSFGNIFGSNIANIGLIIGIAGLIRPLKIQNVIVSREIPMMLVATMVAGVLALDRVLGSGPDFIGRQDGVILLVLFGVFLYYTVGDLARRRIVDGGAVDLEDEAPDVHPIEVFSSDLMRNSLITLAGLGALLTGAQFTVDSAMSIALALGVPEVIIGLTLVAFGTSLPELATSVIATLRGHIDLAVGNVVGSNIFNLLLVCGITSVIRPIPIPQFGYWDLAVTMALSLLLWFVSMTQRRSIVRAEAMILVAAYATYIIWRTLTFPAESGMTG